MLIFSIMKQPPRIIALSRASRLVIIVDFALGFRCASSQALCCHLLRRLNEIYLRTLETPH
jgi:hypothetical protein